MQIMIVSPCCHFRLNSTSGSSRSTPPTRASFEERRIAAASLKPLRCSGPDPEQQSIYKERRMRRVAQTETGNSLLVMLLCLAFLVGPRLTFAQPDVRAKIKAFQQAKLILNQHKAALLETSGVNSIKISRETTGFAFKVFISETASQDKIPQSVQGIPVKLIIQRIALPAPVTAAFQRAKEVRDRYKLHLSKLGHVQIVGQPGGQFILVVAVDSPQAQKEVPTSLGGIEVRSYLKAEEPEMADPAYRRAKAIQVRYADDLLEYDGVVGFGVTRKELVTSDVKDEQDGKTYVLRVYVQDEEDLLYVPHEIEGLTVVTRVTGIVRAIAD
jgi:hypothetical protein